MKAILVTDMPTDCEDCVFGFDYRCYMTWKQFEEKEDEENGMVTYQIPEWCPLKPMPKRKNEYTDIDAIGWNACLKEIENEQINKSIQEKEKE